MYFNHVIYVFQETIFALFLLVSACYGTPIIIMKIYEFFNGDKNPKKF